MRCSGCAQATREDVREQRIGRVHALEALADDATAANPGAVLGFDHDRFDVFAARFAANVEDARSEDLACGRANTEAGLERRRHEGLAASERFLARTRDEREERRA